MRSRKTIRRAAAFAAAISVALLFAGLAGSASAAVGPKWRIDSFSNTSIAPGGKLRYIVEMHNVGDQPITGSSSEIVLLATLPPGVTADTAQALQYDNPPIDLPCANAEGGPLAGAQKVVCKNNHDVPAAVGSGENFQKLLLVANIDPGAAGTLTALLELSGGGAPSVSIVDPVSVTEETPSFGIDALENRVAADPGGALLTKAGAHPYETTAFIDFATATVPPPAGGGEIWPIEPVRDIAVELPPGFVGVPAGVPQCTVSQLAAGGLTPKSTCPPASQVGTATIRTNRNEAKLSWSVGLLSLYNMVPPPGVPARFAFNALGSVVTLDAELRSDGDYGLTVRSRGTPQALPIAGATTTFWGVPASEDNRPWRACPGVVSPFEGGPNCASDAAEVPFMRNPTACTPPGTGLATTLRIDSWDNPGQFVERTVKSHELPGYPAPPADWGPEVGIDGCDQVPVQGSLEAEPTALEAEAPSGLKVHLEVPNPGLNDYSAIASSDLKKVRVTLPQGVTINPSQAEGLEACSLAEYESTELSFDPTTAEGCSEQSKIGSVIVKSPLIEETIPGSVYVSKPFDNPFNSLLAIYVVLAEPQRGVLVKLAGKVDTDATTGQVVTTFDDLPQLPFDTFDFQFKEGPRAPLVLPSSCGEYTIGSEIWGHSDPDGPPIVSESSFEIDRGIGGGPCPSGPLGFDPGFSAGTVDPIAGAFSPMLMRLTRRDGEQELTKFSTTLAPGLLAKLAGVSQCSDAAIAAARVRDGREELASPSCPANSKIGRTLAGAGVRNVLTYVPGSLYLAGPYNGAPLSIASVTPTVAGPFDLGTVVVRVGLKLDPKTAIAQVDGSASDPIPHILEGIPLRLRDLRVYVDRQGFTLNPTSCDPMQIGATLWGSSADLFSSADDSPVERASRFQAANCAALGFKPRLSFRLKGGTKRSKFPALRAELKAAPGEANIGRVRVRLPKSEFLAQGHIGTSCTRVQFAAGAGAGEGCPANSVYGWARAWTPLLDEVLEGPVFLRSNGGERELPDLVASLRGLVDIELEGHIDSKGGGLRTTFESVPDAPVSKFVLAMKGGKKGLLENSTNICLGVHRATVEMDGQNGTVHDFKAPLKAKCGKKKSGKRGGGKHRR